MISREEYFSKRDPIAFPLWQKATTEEGLGISGQGDGISAFCQLLLVTD